MENRQRTKHRLRCKHTFRSINSFQQNIHPLRPYFGMLVLSAYYKRGGGGLFMYNHHVEPWKWLKSYFKLFLKSDLGIKERFHMHTLIGFNHFVVRVIRMGLFLVLQSGNTPLHLAVTRGQLGTVKLLLGYRPIFSIPNLVSSRVCYLIFARVS